MDVLLSAVASDLTGRLISFLIRKYQEPGTSDDSAIRLQRLLLRARAVVEEAEGRQIASRAMLQQLNQLRRELCSAAYALDTFRRRAVQVDRKSHATVRVSRSGSHAGPQPPSSDFLSVMVKSLEDVLNDMKEFVVLLNGCPRVSRQPYSAYLFMESSMFGRQMEKEEIIGFLLRPFEDLDVLPLIGPHEVGKRTLVEHVCLDERVQERFSKIHHLSSTDLDDLETDWSLFNFSTKSVMVINMVDSDPDAEESWRRFYASAVGHRVHSWSKIIVISRTGSHSSLGTVPSLKLRALRREELWYFFKALAFGAADPEERPDLVRIAMELCDGISDYAPYIAANIIATSLRADICARSWHRVRKMGDKARMLQLGAANDRLDEYKKVGRYYLWRPLRDLGVPCFFSNRRKLINVERNQLPKVTMPELIAGSSVRPPAGETRFDMLVWQSRIPPYASYVATCDLERSRQLLTGAKRARKRDQQDDHQQRCV